MKPFALFLPAIALLLAACSTCGLDSQMALIKPGMNSGQVENILGRPSRIDQSETTGLTGIVYHYSTPAGEARVVFVNDAVFTSEFVSGAKS